jgi:toxin ParE1/3/4
MPQVTQRQIARNDLIEHFIYLAENAGLDIADRFLTNAETPFNLLAEQPKLGVALALRSSDLTGLRKWHVKDFEDVLIFYQPRPDGVVIVRVLHGTRDWWRLLKLDV